MPMVGTIIIFFLLLTLFFLVSAVLGLAAFIRQMRRPAERADSERSARMGERLQAQRLLNIERRLSRLENRILSDEHLPAPDTAPPAPPGGPETEAVHQPPGKAVSAPEESRVAEPVLGRLEKAIGERWIAWTGALVIFLAVSFFVKHAIDMGWLGPAARCALGAVAGTAMALCGDFCLRRKMRGLGQGLIGGGLAVLYLSIFAAFSFYELIDQEQAFVFMATVTAGGMTLAVMHNALPIAFLAILGGLLTPVLCDTGQDRRDSLFAYITMLNLGVLGIAVFRRWRSLDVLAFAGTWLLFGGWYARFYTPEAIHPALGWVFVFFVIFLLIPAAYHLRTGRTVPLERFIMEMINAAAAFGFAFAMLYPEHTSLLGFTAVGMAVCYTALGGAMSRRCGGARDVLGFTALAMIFVTIAVPLHMGLHGTMILWVAEAVVLLYLGYRFRYLPVRIGAFVVLIVAVIRFFTVHWPLHDMDFVLFWNTSFGTAIFLPLGAAVFAWLHSRREARTPWDTEALRVSVIGACLLSILILHSETGLWLVQRGADPNGFDGAYAAKLAGAFIWTAGALCMIAGGVLRRSSATRLSAIMPLTAGLFFTLFAYTHDLEHHTIFFNLRFLASLAVTAAALISARSMKRDSGAREGKIGDVIFGFAILLLLCFLSLETWKFSHALTLPAARARWLAHMSVSVTWGIYAMGMLALGFLRKKRMLRLTALALFGAAGLKLVLVDMAGVQDIYRVVSFLAIGLLMVGASYLYHKAEQALMRREDI